MKAAALIKQLNEGQSVIFAVQERYEDGPWHDDGKRYCYADWNQALAVYRDFVQFRTKREPSMTFRIIKRTTIVSEEDVTPQ